MSHARSSNIVQLKYFSYHANKYRIFATAEPHILSHHASHINKCLKKKQSVALTSSNSNVKNAFDVGLLRYQKK